MKELKRTRRLLVVSIIFVFVIIIGLLSFRKPAFEYKLSNEEMLEELYNIDNEMLPDEAMEILAYEDSSYVFVDLRNPKDYDLGYLGNAINIPVSDILDEEHVEYYRQLEKDSLIIVLYGQDQLQANGPWMILKQLGFTNMKVLLGGYEYMADEDIDYYDQPEIPEYFVEEPFLDFATFMEEASSSSFNETKEEPLQVQPVKRKKKTITEGGC